MHNSLLTTDLHLTSNRRDAYRWGIFELLREQAKKLKVHTVFVLGDLTEAKDSHNSALVNRVVDEVVSLTKVVEKVVVLRGNHDGVDPHTPYFRFLSHLPKVLFCVSPVVGYFGHPLDAERRNQVTLLLPHSRDPDRDWVGLKHEITKANFVLMHATVKGARAENDVKMEGVTSDWFKGSRAVVLSGDVHVPQKVGPVTYVGAPYHVRFGDRFNPRFLWIDKHGGLNWIDTAFPRKHALSLDTIASAQVEPGDQVKVRVELARSEYGQWAEYKKEVIGWAERMQVELVGVELLPKKEVRLPISPRHAEKQSPLQLLESYCAKAKVPKDAAEVGRELLKG